MTDVCLSSICMIGSDYILPFDKSSWKLLLLSWLTSLYVRRIGVMMKRRVKIMKMVSASCWTKGWHLSTETSLACPHTRGLTVVLTLNVVDSVQHRCL